MELRGRQKLWGSCNTPDEEVRVLRAEGAVDSVVEILISYIMYGICNLADWSIDCDQQWATVNDRRPVLVNRCP